MLTKNCLTRYICVNYRNLNGVGILRQRHGKRLRNIFKFPSQKTIIETFLAAICLYNVEKKIYNDVWAKCLLPSFIFTLS